VLGVPFRGGTPLVVPVIRRVLAATPLARSRRFARAVDPVKGPPLARLGTRYGGWAVPLDVFHRDAVCYSAGVGMDISFDLELIRRFQCVVHAFDPTPASIEFIATESPPLDYKFHPYAVCGSDGTRRFHLTGHSDRSYSLRTRPHGDSFVARCRSIGSIMNDLGHDRLDLLKLDIEGAEYEVIDSIIADGIQIRVLCVEFHRTPWIHSMVRAVRQLRRTGLIPVHVAYFDTTFVANDVLDRAPSAQ